MGVPAHDERDLAFARSHNLEVITVVSDDGERGSGKVRTASTEEGVLCNSDVHTGLSSSDAIEQIGEALKLQGSGGPVQQCVCSQRRDILS